MYGQFAQHGNAIIKKCYLNLDTGGDPENQSLSEQ